jgi:hypothetical protein
MYLSKITHQKTVVIKTEVLLKSIPSSAFTAGTKLPFTVVAVTIAELKAKFGITDQQ